MILEAYSLLSFLYSILSSLPIISSLPTFFNWVFNYQDYYKFIFNVMIILDMKRHFRKSRYQLTPHNKNQV